MKILSTAPLAIGAAVLFLACPGGSLGAPAATPVAQKQEVTAALRKDFPGWDVLQSLRGDVGLGSEVEIVAVAKTNSKWTSDSDLPEKETALLIYRQEPSAGSKLWIQAKHALCWSCGGAKGGDLPISIQLANRVLSLKYQGGSRETSMIETKWKLKDPVHDKDLTLIGVTTIDTDTLASEVGSTARIVRDSNVSTMKTIETIERVAKSSSDAASDRARFNKVSSQCAVPPSFTNLVLSEFQFDSPSGHFAGPKCSDASLN